MGVQSGPNADKYYANYSPPFLNSNIGVILLALFKKNCDSHQLWAKRPSVSETKSTTQAP